MLENFIYAQSKRGFLKELELGNVPETAIVFIENTKEIWNRGTFFNCEDPKIIHNASESEDGLMSAEDKIKLNNNFNVFVGVCKTESDVKDKIIELKAVRDCELKKGSILIVEFNYTNTAYKPTFSVNGSEAVEVRYGGSPIDESINTMYKIYGGYQPQQAFYIYTGQYFDFAGWVAKSVFYHSMTQTQVLAGTNTTSQYISAKVLHDSITSMIEDKQDSISDIEEIRQNSSVITINGDGTKFLNDKGEYSEISVGSDVTEETVSDWGFAKQEDIDLPQINQTELVYTIQPNVFNVWGEVATLDITLGEEQEGIVNEFLFQFTSGETPTTLILPDTIKWVNDAPEIEANMTYQCSIINNIGVICGAL